MNVPYLSMKSSSIVMDSDYAFYGSVLRALEQLCKRKCSVQENIYISNRVRPDPCTMNESNIFPRLFSKSRYAVASNVS